MGMRTRWLAMVPVFLLCYSCTADADADDEGPACTCEQRCHRDRDRQACNLAHSSCTESCKDDDYNSCTGTYDR